MITAASAKLSSEPIPEEEGDELNQMEQGEEEAPEDDPTEHS